MRRCAECGKPLDKDEDWKACHWCSGWKASAEKRAKEELGTMEAYFRVLERERTTGA